MKDSLEIYLENMQIGTVEFSTSMHTYFRDKSQETIGFHLQQNIGTIYEHVPVTNKIVSIFRLKI